MLGATFNMIDNRSFLILSMAVDRRGVDDGFVHKHSYATRQFHFKKLSFANLYFHFFCLRSPLVSLRALLQLTPLDTHFLPLRNTSAANQTLNNSQFCGRGHNRTCFGISLVSWEFWELVCNYKEVFKISTVDQNTLLFESDS